MYSYFNEKTEFTVMSTKSYLTSDVHFPEVINQLGIHIHILQGKIYSLKILFTSLIKIHFFIAQICEVTQSKYFHEKMLHAKFLYLMKIDIR